MGLDRQILFEKEPREYHQEWDANLLKTWQN
jgi:hypothetical protein